ncbi:retrovirus-related Pol polyprotein from transposon 17.6 [Trichonephila clavata]|uniref:Retrovirus-related Pol polyprotein from transposon 17.6 n=1 Tax=Trichonephila clavata TaxID=2740835 RepID=A0A8X6H8K2_TRICU|nr:retrovirus-related Pol polyprotein from transposon 17.6 [Trichonephila clavata]
MVINVVDRACLRDSGSSIDVCAQSWINENNLLGEYVWLISPLDEVCHCLPLAKIKIKTSNGEFYTKATIKQDSCDDDLYILGNWTVELIESSEQGVQMINAVVTSSKENGLSLEREEGASDWGLHKSRGVLTKFVSPSEEREADSIEIPECDGGGEMSLTAVKSAEFMEEKGKWPDLQSLWDKAQGGVDKEFKIVNRKLVIVARTRQGKEIR